MHTEDQIRDYVALARLLGITHLRTGELEFRLTEKAPHTPQKPSESPSSPNNVCKCGCAPWQCNGKAPCKRGCLKSKCYPTPSLPGKES